MVNVCAYESATLKKQILKQFCDGVRASGDEVHIVKTNEYVPGDVGVFVGAVPSDEDTRDLPASRIVRRNVIRWQEENGGNSVVIEGQLIGKFHPDLEAKYVRVGMNHHLADRTNFFNKNSPPDRWNKLKDVVGVQPWRKTGEHILICMQNPGGMSTRGVDQFEWLFETLEKIRQHTDRKIVVRPFPRSEVCSVGRFNKQNVYVVDPMKQLLKDDLENAWACICFTTTASTLAIIKGIPLFPGNPGCYGWELGNHSLENIENPEINDREQWFYNLAYSQWSPEELTRGIVWQRIKKALQAKDQQEL